MNCVPPSCGLSSSLKMQLVCPRQFAGKARILNVDVEPNEIFQEILEVIASIDGIPSEDLRLTYSGKLLDPTKSVIENGLKKGTVGVFVTRVTKGLIPVPRQQDGIPRELEGTRSRATMFKLEVTLEELYTGTKRKYAVSKNVTCDKCQGKGVKPEAVVVNKCVSCSGEGLLDRAAITTNTITYVKASCVDCNGTGTDPAAHCDGCNGKKRKIVAKELEIFIQKGMKNGETILCYEAGNQETGKLPGHINFEIVEQPHHVFKRSGDDLNVEIKIGLAEALCGYKEVVKTLDNRELVIDVPQGQVINPNVVKIFANEGMPRGLHNPGKGNLNVRFVIVYPTNISIEVLRTLESCLPPRLKRKAPDSQNGGVMHNSPSTTTSKRPRM